jgi:hypothetical protein
MTKEIIDYRIVPKLEFRNEENNVVKFSGRRYGGPGLFHKSEPLYRRLPRINRKITSPQQKGTVPFFLRKNRDSPQSRRTGGC